MAELTDRRISTILCIAYALVVFYSALMPYDLLADATAARTQLAGAFDSWPMGDRHAGKADMFSNVLLFAPLGLLLATRTVLGERARWRGVVAAVAVSAGLSAAIELVQVFSTSRVASGQDWTLNVLGGLAGGVVGAAIGGPLWRGASSLARQWWVRRPAAVVAVVMATLLAADALYPYWPTLDVSTVWRSIKASQLSVGQGWAAHPWHYWVIRKVAVYATLSALLAGAFLPTSRRRRFAGALVATLLAAGLEVVKVFIASRTMNITNVVTAAAGAALGWMLGAALAGMDRRGQVGLAWRMILAYLVYAAWAPFKTDFGAEAMRAKLPHGAEWLPLYHYAMGGRAADVQNFLATIILTAALTAAVKLHARQGGATARPSHLAAAARAGLLGVALELGQFAVIGRTPTTTDVLCFAVGGALGSWLIGRREKSITQTAAPEDAPCSAG